ncbi:NAD(P)-binding protein [Hyaloscypha variabilis F]|uniref:NAD(P)-binding protein n=1 Tax=Hyaloscypha variabilis (strain UAMH 11265 / GT02V1 / F) TaxID=1149755 RepID=A0A2J6RJ70_HYAVF|nr:NAD(P)-binding protein [Hyaloscypha variabilis F]
MASSKQDVRISIAVAGLGRMGKRHVRTLLNRVSAAQVVAVCSAEPSELDWARNEYKDWGIQVYDSYEQMIQHSGLQAVWVSTSTDVHASQTIAAIEKGLNVLCEKPLSTDIEEAKRVVEIANQNPHLKVMAGFSRRFDASYRNAKAQITNDAIGEPFVIRSQTCDLIDDTGFFVRYAKKNGGMFVDCCIHDLDLSLYYFGDVIPKAVWAVGTIAHHPELKDLNDVDNGVGIVEYWGGKIAYFYCSRTQAHGHDVCTEVVGTKGKVMVNLVPRLDNVTVAQSIGISHKVQPEYWERFEDAFATEANEFIASIVNNTPVPLKLELGLMSLKIGWALQEALLTGERIRFNEKGEQLDGGRARL